MFQISQTNIVIGSVSNTYPGAPLSVILSDFHSVSVSETSQSVEMTLRWPTWRWTWWPTWRFNIVHREKLRSYVYDMAISFENITMQCTYTAHILQVLLTACGNMDYIGLPSWFHSHASLYRSCYIIQYWLHTLPIGGMYLLIGPEILMNYILLEISWNWVIGLFWNTSRSALLSNFYSFEHFQYTSNKQKNNYHGNDPHCSPQIPLIPPTIHFDSIFNATPFLTQSPSDFYQ